MTQILFIGGLHRSGTTLLSDAVTSHPMVSGFHDASVPEREGQYLQTVLPTDEHFGGPGRFALVPEAHFTESSHFATDEVREVLWSQWSEYWDISRKVLVEKSPVNLTRFRLLQKLFPTSAFVLIVRHPIPVTLSTYKWAPGAAVGDLLLHWIHAHDLALADLEQLERAMIVRYEDLTRFPDSVMSSLGAFLGLPSSFQVPALEMGANRRYLKMWQDQEHDLPPEMRDRISSGISRYGYSLSSEQENFAPLSPRARDSHFR